MWSLAAQSGIRPYSAWPKLQRGALVLQVLLFTTYEGGSAVPVAGQEILLGQAHIPGQETKNTALVISPEGRACSFPLPISKPGR